MALRGHRFTMLFGLLSILLAAQSAAHLINHELAWEKDLALISPRAPTSPLPWPCLPDKRRPRATVKDPGALVGVLPYSEAMVIAANHAHGQYTSPTTNITLHARRALLSAGHRDEPKPRSLTKRLGGAISTLYSRSTVQVDTDASQIIWWQMFFDSPEELILGTRDLSGCTALIISSPHVAIMAHVWERRDEATWLTDPNSPGQQAKDAEFVLAGRSLLQQVLLQVGGSAANEFNGWLPRASTTIHVVAPAYNPDAPDLNPWYTLLSHQGLFYENAARSLLAMARLTVGCLDDGEILTYRRRYHPDPAHGTDDRDKIVLAPYILQGHTYVHLMWDDNKLKPIAQIN